MYIGENFFLCNRARPSIDLLLRLLGRSSDAAWRRGSFLGHEGSFLGHEGSRLGHGDLLLGCRFGGTSNIRGYGLRGVAVGEIK